MTEDRKTDGIVGGLSIRHNIALASLRELSGYGIMKGKKEKAKVEELFSRMGIKAPGTEVLLQQLSPAL